MKTNVVEVNRVVVPNNMPKGVSLEERMHEFALREQFIQEGMFGFVSWKWVNPFVKWLGQKNCLEVMAGRGWWSYALEQKGVNVIATDDFSWHNKNKYKKWNETLVAMKERDAVEAVREYGHKVDVVLMSWPFMDDTAYEVIKALYEVNPLAVVAYIGEGNGGCTASDKFFEHFEVIDDELFEGVERNFESWTGINDSITIGRYNPELA